MKYLQLEYLYFPFLVLDDFTLLTSPFALPSFTTCDVTPDVSLMRQKRETSAAGENLQREFLRVLGSYAPARLSDASGRGRR